MVKLFDHQIEAHEKMRNIESEQKGGVLAHEPGCGKTICMASYMKMNKGKYPDLIICPLSLLYVWDREIKRVYLDDTPKILIYHGDGRHRNELNTYDYIISTYTILGKNEFQGIKFHRIALDEAHIIKNGLRKRNPCKSAQYAYKLIGNYKWCISGTPFNNKVSDIESLAMFIGSKPYNNPEWWKNDENIKDWINKFVLIKTKDDMLLKPIYKDIEIYPTLSEKKLYKQIKNEASELYKEWRLSTDKSLKSSLQGQILAHITKLRIMTDSQYCGSNETVNNICKNSSKINEIIDILDHRLEKDESKSVVIFTQFVKFIDLIEKVLSKKRKNVEIFRYTGDMNIKDREITVKKFTTNTNKRVLLISLFSGGVGLTLLPCSTVIMCEPWYNPFVEKQAEERVHRIGQTKQVYIYRISLVNSVETWINGIKIHKLNKAREIGLNCSSTTEMSSTFTMEDLGNLFNKYVKIK